jgi:4-amino-4-deoxy-L-arabinose transferase-like glycosyltransferase
LNSQNPGESRGFFCSLSAGETNSFDVRQTVRYNHRVSRLAEFLVHDRWFKLVVVLLLFGLLGTRGLNEPDEGRYAEIGREMVETGDWLVPNIWYVPHLDKPPMTYWMVGLSIAGFGLNEWAIRLPIALSGLSGAVAIYLLALSIAGRRTARWSVLILCSSILYFAIARMVMTDMILLQFSCWAIYCYWRAWRAVDPIAAALAQGPIEASVEKADETPEEQNRAVCGRQSFLWQLGAWLMMAGGFLTKGPLVFLIVGFALLPLLIFRRKQTVQRSFLVVGTIGGLVLFSVVALPWYLILFERVASSFDYMVKGQVVGHALKAAAKNRGGPVYYFIPILLFGFLPWTVLLGWMWRKTHWHSLDEKSKDAWVLLSGWAGLTLLFFSINSAKLPHYIVPMMPALALLVAMRWPDWKDPDGVSPVPAWVGRSIVVSPFVAMLAIPFVYRFAFKISDQPWIWWQASGAVVAIVLAIVLTRRWSLAQFGAGGVVASTLNLALMIGLMPLVDSEFRSNQTLKPLGAALVREHRDGDAIVVYQRIPQGLPLYTWPLISATNRPYFMHLPQHRMPYHYPGNQDRLEPYTIEDFEELKQLTDRQRVLFVGWRGSHRAVAEQLTNTPIEMIEEVGHWELFESK